MRLMRRDPSSFLSDAFYSSPLFSHISEMRPVPLFFAPDPADDIIATDLPSSSTPACNSKISDFIVFSLEGIEDDFRCLWVTESSVPFFAYFGNFMPSLFPFLFFLAKCSKGMRLSLLTSRSELDLSSFLPPSIGAAIDPPL